ncbi:MAG: hypothetical protein ABEJ72_06880 [Candidatus Aenigmatarchaeota archaeon]
MSETSISSEIMEKFERVLSPSELKEKVERDLEVTREMVAGD